MEDPVPFPKPSHTNRDARGAASISIVVDDRERHSGVIPVLSAMEGIDMRVERLPLGDYLIDDILLFERKTVMDLTASIKDARLFTQACRLVGSSYRTSLILEGTTRELAASQMRREAIQGALISVTLMLGLPLLRAMDASETARLMVYAARQRRAWSTAALPRRGRRPRGKRRAQLFMLQGLPEVGPERARRLLDAFGSIEAVLAANDAELQAIDGIGSTTARLIRWVVSEDSGLYLCAKEPSSLAPVSGHEIEQVHSPRHASLGGPLT